MSTFQVGKVYRYLHAGPDREQYLVCEARWFAGGCGTLEMVRMRPPSEMLADGTEVTYAACERTALVFSGGALRPAVTATLGGVYRPDMCEHLLRFGRVLANAGPNEGKLCCAACGGKAPTPERGSEPREGPTYAARVTSARPESVAEVCGTTCGACLGSHRMWSTRLEREVPCTYCSIPCPECRSDPPTAYCASYPCACDCHRTGRAPGGGAKGGETT